MYVCNNCGREHKTQKGLNNHKNGFKNNGCDYLYSQKQQVIEDYNNGLSIKKLEIKYNVKFDIISDSLKFWGIQTRNCNSPRYKNMGKKIILNEHFFDNDNESKEKYWLLGLYASDGSVNSNNNQICISQSGDSGKKLIQFIIDMLNSDYIPRVNIPKINEKEYKPSYSFVFSSKHIRDIFATYNIISRKSYNFQFPSKIPEKFIKDFLCGYVEGDGSINITNNGKGVLSLTACFVGTKQFIKHCKKIIPIKSIKLRQTKSPNILEIRWNGEKAIQFCEWLFGNDYFYTNSYKYQNFLMAKEKYLNSKRIKNRQYKEQLFQAVLTKQFTTVMDYAKTHPQHKFQTYYRWLKQGVEQGLFTEEDYKEQK